MKSLTKPEATPGDRLDLRISVQLEKPKTLNDRETKVLVEHVLCSCTVGYITACDSRHDIDIHLIHRRLGPKSDRIENNTHPCAQRTLHPFCVVFHTCMVAEPVFLELGY